MANVGAASSAREATPIKLHKSMTIYIRLCARSFRTGCGGCSARAGRTGCTGCETGAGRTGCAVCTGCPSWIGDAGRAADARPADAPSLCSKSSFSCSSIVPAISYPSVFVPFAAAQQFHHSTIRHNMQARLFLPAQPLNEQSRRKTGGSVLCQALCADQISGISISISLPALADRAIPSRIA